jgi:hypothetical protein
MKQDDGDTAAFVARLNREVAISPSETAVAAAHSETLKKRLSG